MVVSSNLKTALLNSLRKYVYDVRQRSTNTIETTTISTPTTIVNLTKTPLSYINRVTVNGLNQRIIRDYILETGTVQTPGKITFNNQLDTDDIVIINYNYGTNWIYPGYPQATASMPRIAIIGLGGGMEPAGVGNQEHFLKPFFRIEVWIRDGEAFTVNGSSLSGDRLLDFYSEEMIKTIITLNNGNEIGNNITITLNEGSDGPFDADNKILKKVFRVSVWQQYNYGGE